MRETETIGDARRAMEVCNACRYCEGYCAVFPAMELRREFAAGDLSYLANLCHNCRGCYYSCQYAPPHEFGINLPRTFAAARLETYAEYAWPRPLAAAFRRNGLVVSLLAAGSIALVLLLTGLLAGPGATVAHTGPRSFYEVIPYWAMATVAGVTFLFSLLAMAMGAVNFWRDTGAGTVPRGRPLLTALHDVLTLKYLGGGAAHGCNDRDETFSNGRRRLHHAMFYGFLLCFASTSTAFVYADLLGWPPPYPFLSLPVLLGTLGGIGLVVGTAGLIWIKVTGDAAPNSPTLFGADMALLALLMLAGITGLLLLSLRATGAMGVLLAIHLGTILALFLLLPYSRFVHGVYRSAALLRYAAER